MTKHSYGKKMFWDNNCNKMQQNLVTRDMIMLVARTHASLATWLTLWAPVFYHQIFECSIARVTKYFIMSPNITIHLIVTPRNGHEIMKDFYNRVLVRKFKLCLLYEKAMFSNSTYT